MKRDPAVKAIYWRFKTRSTRTEYNTRVYSIRLQKLLAFK